MNISNDAENSSFAEFSLFISVSTPQSERFRLTQSFYFNSSPHNSTKSFMKLNGIFYSKGKEVHLVTHECSSFNSSALIVTMNMNAVWILIERFLIHSFCSTLFTFQITSASTTKSSFSTLCTFESREFHSHLQIATCRRRSFA